MAVPGRREAKTSRPAEVGATPAQVALAWLVHHEQETAPFVGARTVDRLTEHLAAVDVALGET